MRHLDEHETSQCLRTYGLDRPRGSGFALRGQGSNIAYDWHEHAYHQLIYASAGAVQIETEEGRRLIPPGRAAWIPAGVRHRTLIGQIKGASLYLAPDAVCAPGERVRILAGGPLMREMILHAARWPLGAAETDSVAASFFKTLALMCGEWLEAALPLLLPGARHPGLVRAMDYAFGALAEATLAGALTAAGMSERSFRRAFLRETGRTWQAWLTEARVLEGGRLLIEGRRVTDAAAAVGYDSLSAFAKAFLAATGETPTQFRSRVEAE